ncbi:hypothetical protein C5167_007373 [Papaver somniferum]|uniref:short-chain dehydrogenase reductase 3b-like n=1 Tax=Papaver somniferum TaxID=3469 RepID=UPI000E6FAF31|nr:short-chain dehydrogenase reductase 3b-like [Papaver somniferum]RZC86185.1 hypothetical protein C5167_007373 [Papaver somniferum]
MSTARLEGKVAIITGAASGIGEAAARLFVENGASVVIADVQDELGDQVVASIGPERCSYKHCDVTDEKQVEEMVTYTLDKYGTLDIVYSNAGIVGSLTSTLDLDVKALEKTIDVNVCGSVAMMKHACRAMVARNIHGSIICTASAGATRGGLAPAGYTASKHALLGVVRSASRELGMYGIRVNCVSPFAVATPMACTIPGVNRFRLDPEFVEAQMSSVSNLKGMILKPKDIAETAMFLASDESACINGHNLVVDGGFPDSMDTFPVNKYKAVLDIARWSISKVTFSSILSMLVPRFLISVFDQTSDSSKD